MASIQVFTGELAGRQHTLTTSRIVARVFGKRHDHVLRDIRALECSEDFRRLNFGESSYLNAQNKTQPEFQMTRDGFMFLVMGFTGAEAAARKQAFIATFNEMEERLKPSPATPLEEQMSRLAGHMGTLTTQMATMSRQLDVTAKYIGLLEINQTGQRKVTAEVQAQAKALKAEGMDNASIGRLLRISRTAVSLLVRDKYPHPIPAAEELPPPAKSTGEILEGWIERERTALAERLGEED